MIAMTGQPVPAVVRIQRALVALWALAVAATLAHVAATGVHLIAAVALTLLFCGHAMVLAAEFAMMAVINRQAAQPDSAALTIVRAWLLECVTAIRIFGWQQPFFSRAWPEQLGAASMGRRGVLLVHGYACSRGLWRRWLEHLQARGVPCIAIDLDPPWAPIDEHRPVIEAAVTRLEQATGLAPVAVGHSMGGLALRAWWTDHSPERLHRLLTLGSPHRGTWLARFGIGASVRQMKTGNDWLADLCSRDGPQRRARTTCFYSACDNIVFPARNATLDGAENRLLAGYPHLHMLCSAAVWVTVLHWLGLDPHERTTPA